MSASWRRVCRFDDVPVDGFLPADVAGKPLVVLRHGSAVSCFYDQCSHQDVPLSLFGERQGHVLICQAHGAEFAITDGQPLTPPACKALTAYPVRVFEGWIEIDWSTEEA
jgi:nitrite reductase/ring-hydroxylating ferredoxin subunit